MNEPDQIEFHERVVVADKQADRRSIPARIGVVAGAAALVVVGAVAAMGASSPTPATSDAAPLSAAVAQAAGTNESEFTFGFRGGEFGPDRFRDITISAINGSSLSLKTDDGWTRTISIGSSTTITKGGQTIAVGALAVGDQVVFSQTRATDGTYTIDAIRVVLPVIGGEVSAVSGNTITVTGRDGTTGTIHVDGTTTYEVDGTTGKTLSDVTVGAFLVAEGTLRTDGSLDADAVHSGMRGFRDGHGGGFRGPGGFGGPGGRGFGPDRDAAPAPTPTTNAS